MDLDTSTSPQEIRSVTTLVLALVLAVVAVGGAYLWLSAPTSSASPINVAPSTKHGVPSRPPGPRPGESGRVTGGVTVFDTSTPAVTRLDRDLLAALRRAGVAAQTAGIELDVTSGWRSRADQERLFREAVEKYGSTTEAARWVAVPGTSAHEAGDAVDLGPTDALSWLSQHGAAYGLCQIYANESWHYELRPAARDHGCPAQYADPTHDPRMQR